MWTQFSFLVTQLNYNYPKSRRGKKWKEWPENGRVGLPGTPSTRHISPDLLRPDKRDPFLAVGSAQRAADQLQPGVWKIMPVHCLCRASKWCGRKRSKYSSGFGSFKDCCSKSLAEIMVSCLDSLYGFFYIIIMLILLQGTSVRFAKPLLSLTDQCKNPGADHTGVQKPSNKLLLAQIFG